MLLWGILVLTLFGDSDDCFVWLPGRVLNVVLMLCWLPQRHWCYCQYSIEGCILLLDLVDVFHNFRESIGLRLIDALLHTTVQIPIRGTISGRDHPHLRGGSSTTSTRSILQLPSTAVVPVTVGRKMWQHAAARSAVKIAYHGSVQLIAS